MRSMWTVPSVYFEWTQKVPMMNASNVSTIATTVASTTGTTFTATTPGGIVLTDNGTPHSTVALVFICISALFSQILTIGGNILVMLSFRVERRLQKPSNYFLLSLAAADLIIGIFSMPVYTLYLIMGSWPFGPFVCDLWLSIDYACSEVSVLNLIMISADRLWSVKSPARYRNKMTLRRAVIMIIPTWVCPILLYFTSVLGWPLFSKGESNRRDDECYLPFLSNSPLFMAISTVVVYWVPLTLLFLMYAYIYRIIRNLSRKKKKFSHHRLGNDESLRARALRPRVSHDHLYPTRTLEPTMMESEALGLGITADTTTTSTTVSALSAEASRGNDVRKKYPPPKKEIEYDRDDPSDETSSSERRRDSEQQQPLRSQPNSNGKKRSSVITFRSSGRKYEVKRRSVKGERQSRSERKATKTLTFILGAFFITWSPYSTMVIIMGYCPTCIPDPLYQFSYYLCYINSTINPLCYAFANELFRATFYKILSCKAFRR
ncbi:muscarinic acetylcholine receptor M2-like isoform X1 [Asterias amurensis]|uniref:muscarinic acetylcholine receptor M2-like isoform X1 n=2 Tax=Asterias amurensis TaxID=7602 RepID=UPI003AB6A33A